ncbi:MAG: class II aldolase/adducin family protein [Anaerolineales bacterium]|nr:class II aldolase/adducin family protein [Anaerolineales bacterium]MCB8954330.1 class II aldolase/adducin family protein [Ardenticatenales bacterium]
MITQLIAVGREIVDAGLVRGSGGNLSARRGVEMWITRSGADLGQLTGADFVPASLAPQTVVNQNGPRPSSELAMHRAAYAARPATQVVLHVHPPRAISLGLVGKEMPAFTPDFYLHLGPCVPLVPYLTPTTDTLAAAVGVALAQAPAALLQNHGVIVVGETAAQALLRLFLLEEHAGIYLTALSAGTPRLLTTQEQRDLDEITGGRYRINHSGTEIK